MQFGENGKTFPAKSGETVFEVGRRNGVDISTACVGQGNCGLCRVHVIGGEAFLSPYNQTEEDHMGNVYFLTKIRLACQSELLGGGTVVVSPVTAEQD